MRFKVYLKKFTDRIGKYCRENNNYLSILSKSLFIHSAYLLPVLKIYVFKVCTVV